MGLIFQGGIGGKSREIGSRRFSGEGRGREGQAFQGVFFRGGHSRRFWWG